MKSELRVTEKGHEYGDKMLEEEQYNDPIAEIIWFLENEGCEVIDRETHFRWLAEQYVEAMGIEHPFAQHHYIRAIAEGFISWERVMPYPSYSVDRSKIQEELDRVALLRKLADRLESALSTLPDVIHTDSIEWKELADVAESIESIGMYLNYPVMNEDDGLFDNLFTAMD